MKNKSEAFKKEDNSALKIFETDIAEKEILMGDKCHICGELSSDDCVSCRRPTCKRHGKRVGDYFVCRDCADKFR